MADQSEYVAAEKESNVVVATKYGNRAIQA